MSKDSGDQGSAGVSGEGGCPALPRTSSCSMTPSIASLNGEGVMPPAGDGGMGEALPGVYGI
jgi:hypothetical protein